MAARDLFSSHSAWHPAAGPAAVGKAYAQTKYDSGQETFSGEGYHSVGNITTSTGRNPVQDKINSLSTFFGVPDPAKIASLSNAYDYERDLYEAEYHDYPELFDRLWGAGGSDPGSMVRNGYLSRLLMEKTKASENYWITRIAPWAAAGDNVGMEYSWDVTKFHRHLLDREPEESVPRMMTSTRASGKASIVRYGICLTLEATFASTPTGRRNFVLNIEQMRIATVETASLGACIRILGRTPDQSPYGHEIWRSGERTGTLEKLNARFRNETESWGLVHKSLEGAGIVGARLSRMLADNNDGSTGDDTIIPQGMSQFLSESERPYYIPDGSFTRTRRNLRMPDAADGGGKAVVESRGFQDGEHQPVFDPFFRHQTIGGFMTLDDSLVRGMDPAKYRTELLDSYGLDGNRDQLYRFRYMDYYMNAGVWNFRRTGAPLTSGPDGTPGIGLGFAFDMQCFTWGQMLRACGRFDHALSKLLLLPAEKHHEFLAGLMLLPQGDPRTRPTRSPGGWKEDDVKLFRDMLPESGGAVNWDKSFTVDQRIKARRDPFGDNPYNEHRRELKRQRAAADLALDVRPTGFGAAKANLLRLAETFFPVENDHLAQPRNEAVKQKAAEFVAKVEAAHGLRDDERIEALNTVARSFAALAVAHKSLGPACSVVGALDDAQITVETGKFEALGSDEAHVKMAITGIQEQAGALSARALSAIDLAVALRSLPDADCNVFETGMRKKASHDNILSGAVEQLVAAVGSAGEKMPLLFDMRAKKSEPNDDGVLRLRVGFGADAASLPLPSDILGATLAANALPIFEMSEDLAKAILNQPAAIPLEARIAGVSRKKYRRDNMTLSLVVSALLSTDKFDKESIRPVMRTIGEVALARLRSAMQNEVPLLLCQEHLRGFVDDVLDALDELLKERVAEAPAADAVAEAEVEEVGAGGAEPGPRFDAARGVEDEGGIAERREEAGGVLAPSYQSVAFRFLSAFACSGSGMLPTRQSMDAIRVKLQTAYPGANQAKLERCCYLILLGGVRVGDKTVRAEVADYLGDGNRALELAVLVNEAILAPKASAAPAMETVQGGGFEWNAAFLIDKLNRASIASGTYFKFCVDNDVPVPLALRLWRPSQTFEMAPVVKIVRGAALTIYKKPDMMLAQNAAQKMIYGHYTTYMTTVVMYPEKIAIMQNVYCRKYIGGKGISAWNATNEHHLRDYADGNMRCDIFVSYVPMNAAETTTNWLSMAGRMPASLGATEDVNRLMHYPGCEALARHWKWNTDARNYDADEDVYRVCIGNDERKFNVICFQELQIRYDPLEGRYSHVVTNKGHWGEDEAPGAARVWNGNQRCFDRAPFRRST